jgi:hypothetical protein
MPVVEPIVATAVLELLHVPPLTLSLSVMDEPTHKVLLPVIVAGVAFTVTVLYVPQPPTE